MIDINSNKWICVLRAGSEGPRHDFITTEVLLKNSGISEDQNRANILERLRQDPSVMLIFDPLEFPVEKRLECEDGFSISISIKPEEDAIWTYLITVLRAGEEVYRNEYPEDEYEECEPLHSESYCALDSCLADCEWVIRCINRRSYFFADKESSLYPTNVPCALENIIGDVAEGLDKAGYQTEHIWAYGLNSPILFVYENEIVMFASRHLGGQFPFIEIKRLYHSKEADKLVERYSEGMVDTIRWDDGSWSFRKTMMTDLLPKEDRIRDLEESVAELLEEVTEIESRLPDNFSFASCDVSIKRQLFIYEVMLTAQAIERLKI